MDFQVLVVSEVEKPSSYLCLSYTEVEGRLEASLSSKKCIREAERPHQANVTSTGPCILPLTQENGADKASKTSQKTFSYQITACLALVSRQLLV